MPKVCQIRLNEVNLYSISMCFYIITLQVFKNTRKTVTIAIDCLTGFVSIHEYSHFLRNFAQ